MLDDTLGRLILVVALLAASTAFMGLRRRRDGTFRTSRAGGAHFGDGRPSRRPRDEAETMSPDDLGAPLGARATLVQFSARTCAACPQVRRTLADVAGRHAGVAHVEVAADERLDLAARFRILRTPTVLLLDDAGRVRGRTSGPITASQARSALVELGVAGPGADPQRRPGANPQPRPGADPQPRPGADPQRRPGADPQPGPGADPQPEPTSSDTVGRSRRG